MAYGLSIGHVTDDVTWPWKVKFATPIRLERNILKTTWARDIHTYIYIFVYYTEWQNASIQDQNTSKKYE